MLLVANALCAGGRWCRTGSPSGHGTAVPRARGHRRGWLWERCLLSAPCGSWVGVFQSNTKSASCSVTLNQNFKSRLSFLFPWINCSSFLVPKLLCLFCCKTPWPWQWWLRVTHTKGLISTRCSDPRRHRQSHRWRITNLHKKSHFGPLPLMSQGWSWTE